jgi:predicted DCC family thiol-disulfide oxidoreductase YuxK
LLYLVSDIYLCIFLLVPVDLKRRTHRIFAEKRFHQPKKDGEMRNATEIEYFEHHLHLWI